MNAPSREADAQAAHSTIPPEPDTDIGFLLVKTDTRELADWSQELERRGVAAEYVLRCCDDGGALRALSERRRMPTVAFVPWPCSDALLGALQARGSYVVALLAPDAWEQAFDAQRRGADDVLLEPASRQAFGVRAALARQILRQRRPAPWHRPRVVLREALAHPTGGDVLLKTESGTTRVLVSRGRVVWVHDEAGGSLLQELQSLGVRIDADELSEAIAECQRTRDHFVEVLARWGLAERNTVEEATRALVHRRLERALGRKDVVALFLPMQRRGGDSVGFTTDELGLSRTIAPPADGVPTSLPTQDTARFDALTRSALAVDGCTSAVVLHYGSATVLSRAGDPGVLPLSWGLGSTLHLLVEDRADAIVCSGERALFARRLPEDGSYFVCVEFDLAATSLALARMSVARLVDGMRSS